LGIQPFVVWEGEDGQPETFAKPATHGAAACRCCQLVKPCWIRHWATSRRCAILDFRLPQGFCKGGSLKKGAVADYGLAAE